MIIMTRVDEAREAYPEHTISRIVEREKGGCNVVFISGRVMMVLEDLETLCATAIDKVTWGDE